MLSCSRGNRKNNIPYELEFLDSARNFMETYPNALYADILIISSRAPVIAHVFPSAMY